MREPGVSLLSGHIVSPSLLSEVRADPRPRTKSRSYETIPEPQVTVLKTWRECAKIHPQTIARLVGVPLSEYVALEERKLVHDFNLGSAVEMLFCARFDAGFLLSQFIAQPKSPALLRKMNACFADFAKGLIAGQRRIA